MFFQTDDTIELSDKKLEYHSFSLIPDDWSTDSLFLIGCFLEIYQPMIYQVPGFFFQNFKIQISTVLFHTFIVSSTRDTDRDNE